MIALDCVFCEACEKKVLILDVFSIKEAYFIAFAAAFFLYPDPLSFDLKPMTK